MYMSMGNWGQAYNEFYEGFINYQEAGNPNAKVGAGATPGTISHLTFCCSLQSVSLLCSRRDVCFVLLLSAAAVGCAGDFGTRVLPTMGGFALPDDAVAFICLSRQSVHAVSPVHRRSFAPSSRLSLPCALFQVCLKYVVLANMLDLSDINPFVAREAKV